MVVLVLVLAKHQAFKEFLRDQPMVMMMIMMMMMAMTFMIKQ